MRPTSLRGIQDGVGQGAVKHGRWNGYGAPDLCVMHVPCNQVPCRSHALLSQTWPYCYRMLTHSHSATSLYNWANLSQWEISLHQLFISRPHLNLRTGVVWPRGACFSVYCKFFAIFTFWLQKYLDFGLFSPFYLRYWILFQRYLSINMETYAYLVSSQIPHILLYI
jgi:hypothetical protein